MNTRILRRLVGCLAAALVLTTAGGPARAAEHKLTASDAAAGDYFGYSVSVSGDTAVIGAYEDDSSSGSAYVFVRSGTAWTQQAKLTASDAVAGDWFGSSVSVSGDTAVIGAVWDNGSGSAYVFVRSGTTWTQQQKLTASDAAVQDFFGTSVSVSGDTAVIGAYGDNRFTGSAYVFVRSGTTWTQQAKLTASDAVANDYFGWSVSVSGDTAVVGANSDDGVGADSGSAYVFTRSGTAWTQQAKLTASDAVAGDQFGTSVSVSGDTAVVGADSDDGVGADSGSAYMFVRSGTEWILQVKLTASDAAAGDQFGTSVSVSGDTALIGTHRDDGIGSNSGSAYVFTHSSTGWTQQAKLTASDAAAGDYFGYSVSVSGDTAVIGAYEDDLSSGSAYVFGSAACGWGRDLPANTWLMTAPSCQPDPPAIGSQYGDDLGGSYGSTWISYKWEANAYAQQVNIAPLVPGFGSWLYSTSAGTLDLSGTATPTTEDCASCGWPGQRCFAIDLVIPPAGEGRWNMVGHPFPYAVNWADVRVSSSVNGSSWTLRTPSEADASVMRKTFHRWTGSAYEPKDDSTPGSIGILQPQEAVWIRTLADDPSVTKIKLLIPAQ